ncbi:MAG: type II toxin-antitoxin system RelB/DinJ family antitoxin [Candidatus Gracilibacteria bacterium]
MAKAVQIRIDDQLKKDADFILEDIGLDMPTAIRLFLKKLVLLKSIPFELKSEKTINGFTPDFEEEILKASSQKDQIGPFKTAKEAIKALKRLTKKTKA